jgi:hypothetical protein
MTPYIWYFAGVLVTALTFFIGQASGRRQKKPPPPPKPPDLICGCRHELSFHDPETNQCHATNAESTYTKNGRHTGYKQIQCTCRQYTGPKPIDQVFQPRIALPEGDA